MKICIIADIHLPYIRNTVQYDALDFALEDSEKKNADLIVFCGDQTADGNKETAEYLTDKMKKHSIPYLIISGNADYRKNEKIFSESSCINEFDKFKIFMLHDGLQNLTGNDLLCLNKAEKYDLVFLHHPYFSLNEPYRTKFLKWRNNHTDTKVFYAHLHRYSETNNDISLPALDPDKNIGESPCIVYYDTETKNLDKSYYYCHTPDDFIKNCGISCYKTIEDIIFSAEHKLKSIELRPQAIKCNLDELKSSIEKWRIAGGNNLSVHFPDIKYENGIITGKDEILQFCNFVKEIKAERITIHVPIAGSETLYKENSLEKISSYYAEFINSLPQNITVGIENLHMKEKNRKENTKPFGCIPCEIIEFCKSIKAKTKHNVGINLDIGHARNNSPLSIENTLGVWYSQVGKMCVGYHVHQVTSNNGVFENHTPITENYGKLISLASFYKCMSDGILADAPIIFEIRTPGGAAKTIEFFKNENQKQSDI